MIVKVCSKMLFLFYKLCVKLHFTKTYLVVYAKIPVNNSAGEMYWEILINVPIFAGIGYHTMLLWQRNPGYVFIPQVVKKISRYQGEYFTHMNNYYKHVNILKSSVNSCNKSTTDPKSIN